jgi:hypothetical protein
MLGLVLVVSCANPSPDEQTCHEQYSVSRVSETDGAETWDVCLPDGGLIICDTGYHEGGADAVFPATRRDPHGCKP